MDFYQKYELIDPLPGEGTRSFRARQIASGREVAVHLLVGGKSAENDTLLTRLRALPEPSLRKLIEVGDNDGTIFVATEAPPFLHLSEWLTEQERAAGAADSLKYTRAGSWKIPTMPAPPPPVAPQAPPPVAPSSGPGEFTSMFQQGSAPVAPPVPAAPQQTPAPPPSGPGEFTRMFQQGSAPAAPPVMPAAPQTPPPATPGEFTRLFQAAQAPPAPPTPAPKQESPDMTATKTMRIPLPQDLPPIPKAEPPPQPTTPTAGEFTRMFQSGGSPPPVAAAPVEPLPPPPPVMPVASPPAAPQAGEFTRMFQSAPPSAIPEPPATP